MEVVDFVEHGAGQEFCTLYFEEFAFDVLGADFDPGVALDLFANVGEGEAAFFFGLLAAAVDDFGIDEDEAVFGALVEADVDDGDLLGDGDLGGGEADALGGVHAVEHLVDELGELGGEFGDGFALFEEDGVGVEDDFVELGSGLANLVAGGDAGELLGFLGFGRLVFGVGGHVLYRSVRFGRLERFYLVAIAGEVAVEFGEAVASEFFEEGAGYGEGDHGLGGDTGGGDDADV